MHNMALQSAPKEEARLTFIVGESWGHGEYWGRPLGIPAVE